MRTGVKLLAVLGIAVGVVACGDSGTTKGSTVSTPNASTVTTSSKATLQAMLLAVGDVGQGWEIGSPINAQDLSDVVKVPCSDAAVNPTILGRLTGEVGIQFSPTDRSSKHLIETLVTGDATQLGKDLQVLFEALQACPTGEASAPATGSSASTPTVTYRAFSIPSLGDQRFGAIFVSVLSPTATWYSRSAMVRVGSVAIVLGLTEVLATPQAKPQISDDSFVQLASAAVARLRSTQP